MLVLYSHWNTGIFGLRGIVTFLPKKKFKTAFCVTVPHSFLSKPLQKQRSLSTLIFLLIGNWIPIITNTWLFQNQIPESLKSFALSLFLEDRKTNSLQFLKPFGMFAPKIEHFN